MGRRLKSINFRRPVPSVAGPGITEQNYFNHIRALTDFNFKIRPQYFQSLTFTQFEKIVESELSNDRTIICVFDMDDTRIKPAEKKKYTDFINKYKSNTQVIICESMPSVEFWFLIHYENTCRHFVDANAVENNLKKHLPHYEKTAHFLEKEGWVKDLLKDNKLQTAIQRAKLFGTSNPSYTNVYKAFEKF